MEDANCIPGLVFVTIITTGFQYAMYFLQKHCSVPLSVMQMSKHERYFNTILSLLHSSVSSIGCLYCFHLDPDLTTKINGKHVTLAYFVASFSLGYFVHDFINAITKRSLKSSWEILIHHTVVIFCFGVAVVKVRFVYFAIVALLCEINSVFLHTRQLLNLANVSKTSFFYRLNSLFNILTYIFFRICTLSWMVRWLVLHKEIIPMVFHTIAVVGMSVMTVVNLILFARLLIKDYWHKVNNQPVAVSSSDFKMK